MHDWNVIATVRGNGFRDAVRLLEPFGRVKRTRFHNVLVAEVQDPDQMLDRLQTRLSADPRAAASLASVIPVSRAFDLRASDEFEAKVQAVLEELLPALAGKSFHVRVHHRGALRMSSRDEEQALDAFLLAALEQQGLSGRITFDDPDAIVAVELVGPRCGVSLVSREELLRHPLLHLD